jgi:hypothetical protein
MIARVFPRKTAASPTDILAFFSEPPMLTLPEISEVHISVAFTYDMQRAEWLANQWKQVGVPVKMGGPAFNLPSGDFKPGMYLKEGYTITSRGCPNHCWFCKVPLREKGLHELEIKPGWNILDDNLLACSQKHILSVFQMLASQPKKPVFTGGLEAKILKPWHCSLLRSVKAKRMYFAYDTPDDYEPLVIAGRMLQDAGITVSSHAMCCYVLIGYKGDTYEKAEKRLRQTLDAGFMPYAMLYRDEQGEVNQEWRQFQREWLRPIIVATKIKSFTQS